MNETKICTLCKHRKPKAEFNRRKASKDGYQNVCRDCNKDRSRQYYTENKEKHVKYIMDKKSIYKERNARYIVEHFKNNPCIDCGNDDIRVLEFDHVRGDKVAGVGRLMSWGSSIDKLQEEMDKCEVRCRNCHTIKSYERLDKTWHDLFLND